MTARKGRCYVQAGTRQYFAQMDGRMAAGNTASDALTRLLLQMRRTAIVMLDDIDAIVPGISKR